MLAPLPPSFGPTRDALHAVAEHVLAAARYRADARIGLLPTPGGFGTPPYGTGEVARVDGNEIVHEDGARVRRSPLTTLGEAAACVGVPLGAPPEVFTPTTACVPDAPLATDAAAVAALAAWLVFADALLTELGARHADAAPTGVTLWPEHFDLANDLGDLDGGTRATYGASPGDTHIAEPYLYAVPWDEERRRGRFTRCLFGAAITYAELEASGAAEEAGRTFLTECAAEVLST